MWINYNRSSNDRINKLIERILKLIYSDQTSTFQELNNEDNSVIVHQKHVETLATLLYEVENNISPVIVLELAKCFI